MRKPAILIVEDEAIVSADIAGKFRKLGYEVAGSTDTGEEAIEIARRQRPSLVLMDVRLAGAMYFLQGTLDSLSANIALSDEHGWILLVNKAWRDFAEQNGLQAETVSEECNYLDVCDRVTRLPDDGHSALVGSLKTPIRQGSGKEDTFR